MYINQSNTGKFDFADISSLLQKTSSGQLVYTVKTVTKYALADARRSCYNIN